MATSVATTTTRKRSAGFQADSFSSLHIEDTTRVVANRNRTCRAPTTRSVSFGSSKRRIHFCSDCSHEGWSDVDSEGYECFGRLHEIHFKEREWDQLKPEERMRQEDLRSEPRSSPTTATRPSSRVYQRVHVPQSVKEASISHASTRPAASSSAYRRAVDMHRAAWDQGWARRMHKDELQPTCTGAHRRVKMVRKIKQDWILGRLLCKLLFISEKRVLNRPLLRGKVHLILTYLAPLWAYFFIIEDTKHLTGSLLTALSIFCCGLFSAILHHMSPRCIAHYKRLRELDHCGIFFMCTISPMVLVAHRGSEFEYLLYGTIQFMLCLAGCLWILWLGFMRTQTLTRVSAYILVGFSQIGLMGVVLRNGNKTEWFCCLNFVWWIIGGLCFGTRTPKLNPDIFSYHEIFHLFSMFAQIALLCLIRSVIDRS